MRGCGESFHQTVSVYPKAEHTFRSRRSNAGGFDSTAFQPPDRADRGPPEQGRPWPTSLGVATHISDSLGPPSNSASSTTGLPYSKQPEHGVVPAADARAHRTAPFEEPALAAAPTLGGLEAVQMSLQDMLAAAARLQSGLLASTSLSSSFATRPPVAGSASTALSAAAPQAQSGALASAPAPLPGAATSTIAVTDASAPKALAAPLQAVPAQPQSRGPLEALRDELFGGLTQPSPRPFSNPPLTTPASPPATSPNAASMATPQRVVLSMPGAVEALSTSPTPCVGGTAEPDISIYPMPDSARNAAARTPMSFTTAAVSELDTPSSIRSRDEELTKAFASPNSSERDPSVRISSAQQGASSRLHFGLASGYDDYVSPTSWMSLRERHNSSQAAAASTMSCPGGYGGESLSSTPTGPSTGPTSGIDLMANTAPAASPAPSMKSAMSSYVLNEAEISGAASSIWSDAARRVQQLQPQEGASQPDLVGIAPPQPPHSLAVSIDSLEPCVGSSSSSGDPTAFGSVVLSVRGPDSGRSCDQLHGTWSANIPSAGADRGTSRPPSRISVPLGDRGAAALSSARQESTRRAVVSQRRSIAKEVGGAGGAAVAAALLAAAPEIAGAAPQGVAERGSGVGPERGTLNEGHMTAHEMNPLSSSVESTSSRHSAPGGGGGGFGGSNSSRNHRDRETCVAAHIVDRSGIAARAMLPSRARTDNASAAVEEGVIGEEVGQLYQSRQGRQYQDGDQRRSGIKQLPHWNTTPAIATFPHNPGPGPSFPPRPTPASAQTAVVTVATSSTSSATETDVVDPLQPVLIGRPPSMSSVLAPASLLPSSGGAVEFAKSCTAPGGNTTASLFPTASGGALWSAEALGEVLEHDRGELVRSLAEVSADFAVRAPSFSSRGGGASAQTLTPSREGTALTAESATAIVVGSEGVVVACQGPATGQTRIDVKLRTTTATAGVAAAAPTLEPEDPQDILRAPSSTPACGSEAGDGEDLDTPTERFAVAAATSQLLGQLASVQSTVLAAVGGSGAGALSSAAANVLEKNQQQEKKPLHGNRSGNGSGIASASTLPPTDADRQSGALGQLLALLAGRGARSEVHSHVLLSDTLRSAVFDAVSLPRPNSAPQLLVSRPHHSVDDRAGAAAAASLPEPSSGRSASATVVRALYGNVNGNGGCGPPGEADPECCTFISVEELVAHHQMVDLKTATWALLIPGAGGGGGAGPVAGRATMSSGLPEEHPHPQMEPHLPLNPHLPHLLHPTQPKSQPQSQTCSVHPMLSQPPPHQPPQQLWQQTVESSGVASYGVPPSVQAAAWLRAISPAASMGSMDSESAAERLKAKMRVYLHIEEAAAGPGDSPCDTSTSEAGLLSGTSATSVTAPPPPQMPPLPSEGGGNDGPAAADAVESPSQPPSSQGWEGEDGAVLSAASLESLLQQATQHLQAASDPGATQPSLFALEDILRQLRDLTRSSGGGGAVAVTTAAALPPRPRVTPSLTAEPRAGGGKTWTRQGTSAVTDSKKPVHLRGSRAASSPSRLGWTTNLAAGAEATSTAVISAAQPQPSSQYHNLRHIIPSYNSPPYGYGSPNRGAAVAADAQRRGASSQSLRGSLSLPQQQLQPAADVPYSIWKCFSGALGRGGGGGGGDSGGSGLDEGRGAEGQSYMELAAQAAKLREQITGTAVFSPRQAQPQGPGEWPLGAAVAFPMPRADAVTTSDGDAISQQQSQQQHFRRHTYGGTQSAHAERHLHPAWYGVSQPQSYDYYCAQEVRQHRNLGVRSASDVGKVTAPAAAPAPAVSRPSRPSTDWQAALQSKLMPHDVVRTRDSLIDASVALSGAYAPPPAAVTVAQRGRNAARSAGPSRPQSPVCTRAAVQGRNARAPASAHTATVVAAAGTAPRSAPTTPRVSHSPAWSPTSGAAVGAPQPYGTATVSGSTAMLSRSPRPGRGGGGGSILDRQGAFTRGESGGSATSVMSTSALATGEGEAADIGSPRLPTPMSPAQSEPITIMRPFAWQERETRHWLEELGLATTSAEESLPLLDNPLRNGVLLAALAARLVGYQLPPGVVTDPPRDVRSARTNILCALDHLGLLAAPWAPPQDAERRARAQAVAAAAAAADPGTAVATAASSGSISGGGGGGGPPSDNPSAFSGLTTGSSGIIAIKALGSAGRGYALRLKERQLRAGLGLVAEVESVLAGSVDSIWGLMNFIRLALAPHSQGLRGGRTGAAGLGGCRPWGPGSGLGEEPVRRIFDVRGGAGPAGVMNLGPASAPVAAAASAAIVSGSHSSRCNPINSPGRGGGGGGGGGGSGGAGGSPPGDSGSKRTEPAEPSPRLRGGGKVAMPAGGRSWVTGGPVADPRGSALLAATAVAGGGGGGSCTTSAAAVSSIIIPTENGLLYRPLWPTLTSLPYTPSDMAALESSLLQWLAEAGAISRREAGQGFSALLPMFEDGTFICWLVSNLSGKPIVGAHRRPLTEAARRSNWLKAIEALRKLTDMSRRFLAYEEALIHCERPVLTGLLADLHRLAGGQPPAPSTTPPDARPYLPYAVPEPMVRILPPEHIALNRGSPTGSPVRNLYTPYRASAPAESMAGRSRSTPRRTPSASPRAANTSPYRWSNTAATAGGVAELGAVAVVAPTARSVAINTSLHLQHPLFQKAIPLPLQSAANEAAEQCNDTDGMAWDGGDGGEWDFNSLRERSRIVVAASGVRRAAPVDDNSTANTKGGGGNASSSRGLITDSMVTPTKVFPAAAVAWGPNPRRDRATAIGVELLRASHPVPAWTHGINVSRSMSTLSPRNAAHHQHHCKGRNRPHVQLQQPGGAGMHGSLSMGGSIDLGDNSSPAKSPRLRLVPSGGGGRF